MAQIPGEGDYSLAMRQSIVEAKNLAAAEEQRAADLTARARITELTQQQLNKQASAVEMVTAATQRQAAANDNLAGGMRSQRAAMTNAGQQLQDMAVQFQMGTAASTILAQQLPQLSYALSGLEGSANKTLSAIGGAASFMAGPWGAAIMAGTVVLGPFIAKLFATAEAADSVKFATSAMGDAQSILGGVLDLTTGKINNQSSALRALAEAQLLVAKVEATTRAAEARRGVAAIQNRPLEFLGNGFGGGIGYRGPSGKEVAQALLEHGDVAIASRQAIDENGLRAERDAIRAGIGELRRVISDGYEEVKAIRLETADMIGTATAPVAEELTAELRAAGERMLDLWAALQALNRGASVHSRPAELADKAIGGIIGSGNLIDWRPAHPVPAEIVEMLASLKNAGDAVRVGAPRSMPLR